MYKNQFVSELPINEVKKYFDELRYKSPWTKEDSKDFELCRERLVVQACKTIEQIDALDKIKAEIQGLRNCSCSCSDGIIDDVEDIIDKYRKEQTEE